ncbi:S1 family peptidase [Tellurirhabdus bombi]|uniref:S1 family peptidase n=1 Tax=Tellurirhabdus bombi TaxID=2907205 RepID=UPI001F3E8E07|nr:serine protease [Tellurirhabdus bombi]
MEGQNYVPMFDMLTFTTVKITCQLKNGNTSSGTGFIFIIDYKGEHSIPLIITNKHVVKDADVGTMVFSTHDGSGEYIPKKHYTATILDFEKNWTPHPEPKIDLCAMPFAPIINEAVASGVHIYYRALTKDITPTAEQLADFDTMENIVMVGYPNGFSDTTNNKPILRRGVTATNPKINYCDDPYFLIDTAVFPGSSGSPVCIADPMGYASKGNFMMDSRLLLIGVAFAVFLHNAQGKIIQVPINQVDLRVITGIPNNLGIVVRYDKIFDFERYFKLP